MMSLFHTVRLVVNPIVTVLCKLAATNASNIVLTSNDPTKPITLDSSTLIYSMPAGPDIILSYDYYDGSSGSPTTINNQTALAWFDKDKQISISVPTTTLDASLFSKGSQITVSLLPSNGANTGLKVFSYQVEIV